jgi:hypothetical protein
MNISIDRACGGRAAARRRTRGSAFAVVVAGGPPGCGVTRGRRTLSLTGLGWAGTSSAMAAPSDAVRVTAPTSAPAAPRTGVATTADGLAPVTVVVGAVVDVAEVGPGSAARTPGTGRAGWLLLRARVLVKRVATSARAEGRRSPSRSPRASSLLAHASGRNTSHRGWHAVPQSKMTPPTSNTHPPTHIHTPMQHTY